MIHTADGLVETEETVEPWEVKADFDYETVYRLANAWEAWGVRPRQQGQWLQQLGVKRGDIEFQVCKCWYEQAFRVGRVIEKPMENLYDKIMKGEL